MQPGGIDRQLQAGRGPACAASARPTPRKWRRRPACRAGSPNQAARPPRPRRRSKVRRGRPARRYGCPRAGCRAWPCRRCGRWRAGRPALRAGRCGGPAPRPIGLPSLSSQRDVGEVHRRRADEARHEAVGRRVVELERLADLLDHAVLHHHDPVAQGHRLDLVVGDVDRRGAQPLVQLLELDPHLHAQLGVEVARAARRTGTPWDRARWRGPARRAGAGRPRAGAACGAAGSPMPRMSAARLMRFSISLFSNFRIFRPNAMLPATLMCG